MAQERFFEGKDVSFVLMYPFGGGTTVLPPVKNFQGIAQGDEFVSSLGAYVGRVINIFFFDEDPRLLKAQFLYGIELLILETSTS